MLDRTSSIKADISVDGEIVAKDVTIPLFKREAHPGYFDIIYSLQQLAMFKSKRVHRISLDTYAAGSPNTMLRSVRNFMRDSPDNLLNDSDLKTWWRYYDDASQTGRRRTIISVNTPISNTRLSCVRCGNTAHYEAHMLAFCSDACVQNF